MAQTVKNLQETQDASLGWEDPLEEEMATHSSILAWRSPMDRGAWRAMVNGVAELDTTQLIFVTIFYYPFCIPFALNKLYS